MTVDLAHLNSPSTQPRQVGLSRPRFREQLLLFVFSSGVLLAIAALATLHFGVYEGDSLSRAFGAASVLYGDHRSLTNIGFIWPPFSTIAQLPFALVRPIIHLGVTSNLVSVIFAALSLVVLNRILSPILPSRRPRLLVLALYQLNPMILLYAINGMSESVLLFFVVLGLWGVQLLLSRAETGANGGLLLPLMLMGSAAGLGFLSRYEGLVFGGVMLLVVGIALVGRPYRLQSFESYSIVYLVPFAYAIGSWLLINWLIMGDPLYFLNAEGSNRDQSITLVRSYFTSLTGNAAASMAYVGQIVFRVFPAFYVVVPLLTYMALFRRDRFAAAVVLAIASIPVFQFLLQYTGQSFGWYRFQIYVIPLGVIGLVLLVERSPVFLRPLARVLLVVGMIASSLVTLYHLSFPTLIGEGNWFGLNNEPDYVNALVRGQTVDNFLTPKTIASRLRETGPNARVLADERQADAIILFDGYIDRYVTGRTPNYRDVVDDPVGHGIDYILVPNRAGPLQNFIVNRYPGIYENGAPFLELEAEWEEWRPTRFLFPETWRLYRVKHTT